MKPVCRRRTCPATAPTSFGRAVYQAVVDDCGIDGFPEEGTQRARAFGKHGEVDVVEVVFVSNSTYTGRKVCAILAGSCGAFTYRNHAANTPPMARYSTGDVKLCDTMAIAPWNSSFMMCITGCSS